MSRRALTNLQSLSDAHDRPLACHTADKLAQIDDLLLTATAVLPMPSQIEKLEGRASHLLDAFILLRERYAMLDPMLFDADVIARRGSGGQTQGFRVLKNSLFLSCAQDIAKLTMDDDHRAASLHNIMAALTDDALRQSLRERYVSAHSSLIENETDPEVVAMLRELGAMEEADRRTQFDSLYREAVAAWAELATSAPIDSFRTVRDKISAHTEVQYVVDKYQFVDIGTLGLKWGELKRTIARMQRLVEIVGLLVRSAGFAWELLDEQLTTASKAFWRGE